MEPKLSTKTGVAQKSDAEAAMVARVAEWVKQAVQRQRDGKPVFDPGCLQVEKITGEICGVSPANTRYCVKRVKNAGQKRKRGRKAVVLDSFQERGLAQIVLGYYSKEPPVLPTVAMVHADAREMFGFPEIGTTTLRKWLKKLGFGYSKRDKKLHVFQRKDVAAQRHKYLRDIAQFRELGYLTYFQEWVNAYHVKEYCWQYKGDRLEELTGFTGQVHRGGIKHGDGKGKRLIVNHIGSSKGFLDGCKDVFEATKKIDYHDEMDSTHWEKWLKEKVLPSIAAQTDRAVIAIDNASYHSRTTDDSKTVTTANRKKELQDWLTGKGIVWDEKDTKEKLLMRAKTVVVVKKYVVDEIVRDFCADNNVDQDFETASWPLESESNRTHLGTSEEQCSSAQQ